MTAMGLSASALAIVTNGIQFWFTDRAAVRDHAADSAIGDQHHELLKQCLADLAAAASTVVQ